MNPTLVGHTNPTMVGQTNPAMGGQTNPIMVGQTNPASDTILGHYMPDAAERTWMTLRRELIAAPSDSSPQSTAPTALGNIH